MSQYYLNIDYWWIGILTYLPCHLLHILVWRIRPPRREVVELFLFLMLLPAALALIGLGISGTFGSAAAPLVMHFLVAANYIAIYPAFQASSPTVHLLCLLARRPGGLTEKEIIAELTQSSAVEDRVKDLTQSRLVVSKEGELGLSTTGKWLAGFFLSYRRFLGLEQGAG